MKKPKQEEFLALAGYFDGKTIKNGYYSSIENSYGALDGRRLDAVTLDVTIVTFEQCDNLMKLLQIIRETLHTQGRNHSKLKHNEETRFI